MLENKNFEKYDILIRYHDLLYSYFTHSVYMYSNSLITNP